MGLSQILGKPKGSHKFAADSRWAISDDRGMMGWEFEYEGVATRTLPINTFAGFWSYHEEGSLKDHGAEYVFTNPLFGVDAWNALDWLTSHARDSEWKCSKRTGIHVHLDVRDLEGPQLVGLCILYAALEPILYRWIGDGRENSHFCLPLYKADQALLATCNILSAVLSDQKAGGHSTIEIANNYQRYAGFNLQALAKFGSIEFRHMQTTHNLERIVDWGNMVLSLKSAAFKLPTSDGAVVRMMERMGAWGVLNYVFNPRLAALLQTEHSEGELMKVGLPSARDIGVHSCQDMAWKDIEYPKGTHTGFVKWIKEGKIEKQPKITESPANPIPLDGNDLAFLDDDMEGEEETPVRRSEVSRVTARPRTLTEEFQNQWAEANGTAPPRFIPFNNGDQAVAVGQMEQVYTTRMITEGAPIPIPAQDLNRTAAMQADLDAIWRSVRLRHPPGRVSGRNAGRNPPRA